MRVPLAVQPALSASASAFSRAGSALHTATVASALAAAPSSEAKGFAMCHAPPRCRRARPRRAGCRARAGRRRVGRPRRRVEGAPCHPGCGAGAGVARQALVNADAHGVVGPAPLRFVGRTVAEGGEQGQTGTVLGRLAIDRHPPGRAARGHAHREAEELTALNRLAVGRQLVAGALDQMPVGEQTSGRESCGRSAGSARAPWSRPRSRRWQKARRTRCRARALPRRRTGRSPPAPGPPPSTVRARLALTRGRIARQMWGP